MKSSLRSNGIRIRGRIALVVAVSFALVCPVRSLVAESGESKPETNQQDEVEVVDKVVTSEEGAGSDELPEESPTWDWQDDTLFLEPLSDEPETGVIEPELPLETERTDEDEEQNKDEDETAEQRTENLEEQSEFADVYAPSVQRMAIHQALGTGETLLGNLSGLRGAVTSPFLPPRVLANLPLRFGPLTISRPVVSAGVSAGRSAGNDNDGGWQVSGLFGSGLQATYPGNYSTVTLSYGFSLTFPDASVQTSGSDSSNGIGFNQQLDLGGSWNPPNSRWRLGAGLSFTGLSTADRDTGSDTDRQIATAILTASYDYSQKTSFDWAILLPIRNFSGGVSSSGLTNTFSVNNRISHKTSVGLGYSIGFLGVDRGENQVFQQLLLDARSSPTVFLSFNSTLGLEYRTVGDSSSLNPIFGLGASWSSLLGTEVSLAAEQRVFNSASEFDTNYTSTSFVLSVSQALGSRLTGLLSFGYEHADYDSVGAGGEGGRIDNLYTVELGLAMPITTRLGCSLSGQWGQNNSNVEPFSFSQVTFQMSYAF